MTSKFNGPLSMALAFGTAATLLTACSTGGQKLTKSGFLPQYEHLQSPQKKRNVALWIAPDYTVSRYETVTVEDIEWHAPRRDAKTEAMLRTAFRDRLIEALSPQYRVVLPTQADATTLRVRGAITGVRRTRWFLNAPLQAVTFAAGGLGVLAPLRGGGTEEIQVEDARSGKPVVQMVTYRNGQPWNVKGSYVAYDHARQAFDDAAEILTGYLADPKTAVMETEREKRLDSPIPKRKRSK